MTDEKMNPLRHQPPARTDWPHGRAGEVIDQQTCEPVDPRLGVPAVQDNREKEA